MELNHELDLFGDPAEPARTEWLAAVAAAQYAERVPLSEIETEPLEALVAVIETELRERQTKGD